MCPASDTTILTVLTPAGGVGLQGLALSEHWGLHVAPVLDCIGSVYLCGNYWRGHIIMLDLINVQFGPMGQWGRINCSMSLWGPYNCPMVPHGAMGPMGHKEPRRADGGRTAASGGTGGHQRNMHRNNNMGRNHTWSSLLEAHCQTGSATTYAKHKCLHPTTNKKNKPSNPNRSPTHPRPYANYICEIFEYWRFRILLIILSHIWHIGSIFWEAGTAPLDWGPHGAQAPWSPSGNGKA